MVFFRKGQLNEVHWAGKPHDKTAAPKANFLEPRASFQRWTEIVVGMSKEWTEDQCMNDSILPTLGRRWLMIL